MSICKWVQAIVCSMVHVLYSYTQHVPDVLTSSLTVCLALQVSKLGVTSILVSTNEGVSVKTLKQGLQAYSKQTR